MSSTQKPSIEYICKLSFEVNGFQYYEMKQGFNQIHKIYRYLICKYNSQTNKTHLVFFGNKRIMMNFAFKKGLTSYNPFEINKKTYVFKDKMIYRVCFDGNRMNNFPQLKSVKNA